MLFRSATININSIGAVAITNPDGSALQAGQIVAGQVASLIYQGTSFHLVVTGTNPLTLPFLTGLSSTATIYDSAGGTAYQIGFRQLPPNVQNANYTTVLADDGKFLYHSDGTAYSYTVNNSLAYNVGATKIGRAHV